MTTTNSSSSSSISTTTIMTTTTKKKDDVLDSVKQDGLALKYSTDELRSDRQVVMEAVRQNGRALRFASPHLTKDKLIILAALKSYPEALKFAHDDVKHDPELLIASGMFDAKTKTTTTTNKNKNIALGLFSWMKRKTTIITKTKTTTKTTTTTTQKIVLSTRYSLNRSSFSDATNFTMLLKSHEYIQQTTSNKTSNNNKFKVYAPNAFDKKTCDPNWTDFDWPCRGTKDTCQFNNILSDTGHPTDESCWRYSFRYQLQEAKVTCGFILQLIERDDWWLSGSQKLGNGQQIEYDMAKQLQVKIFHVYRPEMGKLEGKFQKRHIDMVVAAIKKWYDEGCMDMSVCILRPEYS